VLIKFVFLSALAVRQLRLWLVLLPLTGVALVHASIIAPTDLYRDAMLAITEGRLDDAQSALSALVVLEPHHAGAWLDLAMVYCSVGNGPEAERLFTQIETRFAPPTPILEVIARQRRVGCGGARVAHRVGMRLSRGFESNVNQGASNPNFSIGSGAGQIDLALRPEYQPRSDQFSSVFAEFGRDLSAGGASGLLQLQSRAYDHLSAFNTSSLFASVEQPWLMADWGLRAICSAGWVTLDGRVYLQQQQLQLEVLPSLDLPAHWQWGVTGNWGAVHYPTLVGFDAQWRELRAALNYRKGETWLQASLGVVQDLQMGQRPGGDRSGSLASLQGQFEAGNRMLFEAGWQLQRWQAADLYFPGLIDVRRAQQTSVLRLAAVFPTGRGHALTLEFKDVRNDENISIFEYHNQSVQLGWQWRYGVN